MLTGMLHGRPMLSMHGTPRMPRLEGETRLAITFDSLSSSGVMGELVVYS